jgi:serine/threonine protein kinase
MPDSEVPVSIPPLLTEDRIAKPGALTLTDGDLPVLAKSFLSRLERLELLPASSAERFLEQASENLHEFATEEMIGGALVHAGFLTDYQLKRVLAGSTHGLILGNYRVLNRLGAGAMGVVFLAEHMLVRREVAIKVLPLDEDLHPAIL